MAHKCVLTGKNHQKGHRVSHANNKTNHTFYANVQKKRFFIPSLNRFVTIKLSTSALRTVDKLGIEVALKKFGVSLAKLTGTV